MRFKAPKSGARSSKQRESTLRGIKLKEVSTQRHSKRRSDTVRCGTGRGKSTRCVSLRRRINKSLMRMRQETSRRFVIGRILNPPARNSKRSESLRFDSRRPVSNTHVTRKAMHRDGRRARRPASPLRAAETLFTGRRLRNHDFTVFLSFFPVAATKIKPSEDTYRYAESCSATACVHSAAIVPGITQYF